jgi:ABC-2 type transport system permease protein
LSDRRDTQPVWLFSVLRAKLVPPRLNAGQWLTRAAFVLTGLAIAVGIYIGSRWFLQLCFEVEAIGPLLCRRLLDLVLLVLVSVLLLSNIVTALSSFFLARDLELLVSAPVPPRTLFAARFTEQVVHSSWMVLAFGLPTLLAFASVAGDWRTYLAILATVPPLLVYPAAAGFIIAILLVTYLPAARVRDLVVGMVFVAFLVLYVLVRLAEPERFLNPDGFASLVNLLTSLSGSSSVAIPSNWATAIVAGTFRDTPGSSGAWLLAVGTLWCGAAASHAVASLFFRLLHTRAYSRSQEGRRVARLARALAWLRRRPLPNDGPIRGPGRRAPALDLVRLLCSLAPRGATREFLIKDLKLLLRDASQWSQLVLLLALVFVYLYNFRHFRQIGESGLIGQLALFLVGMALSGFVTTAVSVRFAFPLVSLEGRMMWLLRSAPLRPRQVLWSKLMATLPPLLVVAEVMSVASSMILGASIWMVALGAVVAACTALSVSSLAIGLGAALPDYHAESAAKVAASFGGLVCMSVAMVVALVLVLLAIYPAWVIHADIPLRVGRLVFCGIGGAGITATAVVVPLILGARSLSRHEG